MQPSVHLSAPKAKFATLYFSKRLTAGSQSWSPRPIQRGLQALIFSEGLIPAIKISYPLVHVLKTQKR